MYICHLRPTRAHPSQVRKCQSPQTLTHHGYSRTSTCKVCVPLFILLCLYLVPMRALLPFRWRQPTLSIHKVDVTGPAHSTVIPSSAQAAVSIRIVPDQSLEEISKSFVNFLEGAFAQLKSSNTLEVRGVQKWTSFFYTTESLLIQCEGILFLCR